MDPARRIIHLDLDAFYCAVEEKLNPALHGKPFAVGGKPSERGVVASCSYSARERGVRSAMPMGQALRLCPDLLIVSGHYQDYAENSKAVMALLHRVTPLVEQISIDEAFLDVSDLTEDPAAIARRLQAEILDTLGLPNSLGVAANKLVAKIASDYGKNKAKGGGPPNALTIVLPGTEQEFLAPQAVRALWGVGPKTEARLAEMGIKTIGELAGADRSSLISVFGKHGVEMAFRALGIDDSPIVTEHEPKSFSQEITFSRDLLDAGRLRTVIEQQAVKISSDLQRRNLTAATVKIKIRWPDFTTISRQITLSQPTNEAAAIASVGWNLFIKAWEPRQAVRLIGVGVSGLSEPPRQLELWDGQN